MIALSVVQVIIAAFIIRYFYNFNVQHFFAYSKSQSAFLATEQQQESCKRLHVMFTPGCAVTFNKLPSVSKLPRGTVAQAWWHIILCGPHRM
jgi:hypothetical protein